MQVSDILILSIIHLFSHKTFTCMTYSAFPVNKAIIGKAWLMAEKHLFSE